MEPEQTERLSIALSPELLARIKERAWKQRQTVSQAVRFALEDWLAA